jgi:hypothetical protein
VLTDIGGDPDDQQSLIRLLVHSNEFEIEGLIATASGTPGELKEAVTKPHLIRELVEAYGQVQDNLARHADGFPPADELLQVVRSGNPKRGREFIGEGHDTEGSRWIIACADQDDPRPLNIAIWGGQTDLAQALWRVRRDRGERGLQPFRSRVRVFDIDDQDRIQSWLEREFPEVFYVLSKAPPGADKRLGAYRGMYLGGDESLTSSSWVEQNVRTGHGPLGALYPTQTWTAPNPHGVLKEGDTPSWFFFFPNGLGDSSHPEWGGWGGRYVRQEAGLFRDAKDAVGEVDDARAGVWRWRPAFQNEFAARMDWCVADDFGKANHPPFAVLNGDRTRQAVFLTARPGQTIELSSAGSTDPDGQGLDANWFLYHEASSNPKGAALSANRGASVEVTFPQDATAATLHLILSLTDNGSPPITRYRRAVIDVRP